MKFGNNFAFKVGCNQRSAQIIDRSPTYNNPKLITQFTRQDNNFSEYGIDETSSKNCRYNQSYRVNERLKYK